MFFCGAIPAWCPAEFWFGCYGCHGIQAYEMQKLNRVEITSNELYFWYIYGMFRK